MNLAAVGIGFATQIVGLVLVGTGRSVSESISGFTVVVVGVALSLAGALVAFI